MGNRILLIEDNPDCVVFFMRIIKDQMLIDDTTVVQNGREALDYLHGTGDYVAKHTNIMPELIILNLKMPQMSGFELLRQIRKSSRTKFIPVVILSGSDEEADIVKSYSLGANSYINKSADRNILYNSIYQLIHYWISINVSPYGSL